MAINDQQLYTLINSPDFDPEQMGAAFWCEAYVVQKKKNEELEHLASQPRERIRAVEGKVK